jgi:hypothetical protein
MNRPEPWTTWVCLPLRRSFASRLRHNYLTWFIPPYCAGKVRIPKRIGGIEFRRRRRYLGVTGSYSRSPSGSNNPGRCCKWFWNRYPSGFSGRSGTCVIWVAIPLYASGRDGKSRVRCQFGFSPVMGSCCRIVKIFVLPIYFP